MFLVLLLAMIFCHIVDDYYLQGILAQMKQKSWWEKNAPDEMYESDWIIALVEHAISWTFSIHAPLIICALLLKLENFDNFEVWLSASFTINVIIHTIVDDLKANRHKINLVQDQTIHFFQIIITWFVFCAEILTN